MRLRISIFYLIFYIGLGVYQPFMSLFLNQRGFDGSEIGLILSVGSLTGILAQPIFGLLSDAARDYRTILKVLLLLSAIVVMGFFYSTSFVFMVLITIIFSFINTPIGPITDSIAVEKGHTYGFTFGQVRLWGAFGFALISFIAGYVFSVTGFQYSFIVYAIVALILVFLVFTFPKFEQPSRPDVLGREVLTKLFSNWRFDLFVFIGLVILSTVTMNFSYLPIYFQKLNYPINLVGWNFTIAAVVEIPLFWFSSIVIRRIGLFQMLAIGTLAYAIKYTLMGFAPPVGVVLGLQALDGIAFAFYMSSAVEIVNLMAPAHGKATAQTVYTAAGGIAGIVGNMVGGWIIEHQGPQFLFWLMGGIGFGAVLLITAFPKKREYRLKGL